MKYEEKEALYDVYRGILCNNKQFQQGKMQHVRYEFDAPEYEELRKKYGIDKIAGRGTDLQRSIRLMKYLTPRLTHSAWYDNSLPCNALTLLDHSLNQPEHGINCLNKAKILEECCLALGIYARRVQFLPYSPFDFDCHVVTEIYDRERKKWCMLDPTTDNYLVDECGTVLSLMEAREKMAAAEFVTCIKATSREKELKKVAEKQVAMNAYYAKNLFRFQVDAVSRFGESGQWLDVVPEGFSVRQWSIASTEYRLARVPECKERYPDFDAEKLTPLFREALEKARNKPEPEAVSPDCMTEAPE